MLVVDPQVVKMASELTVKLLAEKEVIEVSTCQSALISDRGSNTLGLGLG